MASWRLAKSIQVLRDEINAEWPHRDKSSDGTIGDAAHASRSSDHNPWIKDKNGQGVVRAFDITAKTIDAVWLREHLRRLGAAGHPALATDGYIISDRQIASARKGWGWRPYGGDNPHTKHIHVSTSQHQSNYDATAGWLISGHDRHEGTTVTAEFSPPLHLPDIAADLACPSGGAWLLGVDGGIFAFAGAPYKGGPYGKDFFRDHTPVNLRLPTPGEAAAGKVYVVQAVQNSTGILREFHFPLDD